MKTRVISAGVGLILFAAVLWATLQFPVVFIFTIAVLSGIAVYEMLKNTGLVKHTAILIIGIIESVCLTFIFSGYINFAAEIIITIAVTVIFIFALKYNQTTDLKEICSAFSFPIIISYAFASIGRIVLMRDRWWFLLLLIFVFAWGQDTGAYFAGRFFGKHKLAPNVSPKKTVEGAIGGVISAVVLTMLICFIYNKVYNAEANYLLFGALAVVLSIVGIIGDLSASFIKRATGIKDYGNIMPGHGGVLDRFDSVLLISPIYYLLILNIGHHILFNWR